MLTGQEIQNWIENGCNYHAGIRLLQQLEQDCGNFFAQWSNPSQKNRDAVKTALLKIKHDRSTTEIKPTASKIEKQQTVANEPPSILQLREIAKTWHKKQSLCHSKLSSDDKQERFNNAKQILAVIIPTLDKIYDIIRHYHDTGIEPTDINNIFPTESEDSPNERLVGWNLRKEYENINANITKKKAAIAKKDMRKLAKQQQELEVLEARKEAILKSMQLQNTSEHG